MAQPRAAHRGVYKEVQSLSSSPHHFYRQQKSQQLHWEAGLFSTRYVSSLLLLLHLPPSHLPSRPSLRLIKKFESTNTDLGKVFALKLGVGLSIALHASPTVRTSARFVFFQLFFKLVVAYSKTINQTFSDDVMDWVLLRHLFFCHVDDFLLWCDFPLTVVWNECFIHLQTK